MFREFKKRSELKVTVCQAASSSDGKVGEAFLQAFGRLIAEKDCILSSDGAFVAGFLSPAVQGRNSAVLKWLGNLLEDDPDMLDEHPNQEVIESFKSRIQNVLSPADTDADAESDPDLERLASALGIEPVVTEGPAEVDEEEK